MNAVSVSLSKMTGVPIDQEQEAGVALCWDRLIKKIWTFYLSWLLPVNGRCPLDAISFGGSVLRGKQGDMLR